MKRKQIFYLLLICCFLIFTLGTFYLWKGKRSAYTPAITFPEDDEIGEMGPLRLGISDDLRTELSAEQMAIVPEIGFFTKWESNGLAIWFQAPAEQGVEYQLIIKNIPDLKHSTPEVDYRWTFTIRTPQIIYLVPDVRGGELWTTETNGTGGKQISFTNHAIQSYDIAPDGNEIVFSVTNSNDGADIWSVSREGENQRQLVNCGKDYCSDVVFAPMQNWLIFTKQIRELQDTTATSNNQIWRYDRLSDEVSPYFQNQNFSPGEINFSPNGKFFAFHDLISKNTIIVDINTFEMKRIPCQTKDAGSWTPDQGIMVVTCDVFDLADPYITINEYELVTGTMNLSPIFGFLGRKDYSTPLFSPDGKWIIFGERCLHDRPTKQLWLLSSDMKEISQITYDVRYNHANYAWDNSSSKLLVQRYEIGYSSAVPEVVLMDLESSNTVLIAVNAYRPHWLP